ncbi:MAG: ABC transporter substrate-binding protein, partial [Casimicrobium sp.]
GALHGFISAKILAEALRRAGRSLNTESLTRALDSLNEYDVGDYVVEFNPNTRLGSKFVDATIIAANGRFMR